MGFDSECDLAVEASLSASGYQEKAEAIVSVRDMLVAEHLDVHTAELKTTLLEEGGSLVRTIEKLRRSKERTLLPLELPKADIGPLAENELVDPEHAEPLTKMLGHASRAKIGSIRRILRTYG